MSKNDEYTISYSFKFDEENSNFSASGAIDLRSNRNRPIPLIISLFFLPFCIECCTEKKWRFIEKSKIILLSIHHFHFLFFCKNLSYSTRG
jgi:hypothetical protein